MIRFECPHCGKGLRTDTDLAGQAFTCPGCKGRVRVPKSSASGADRATTRSSTTSGRFSVKPYQPPPFWHSGRVIRAIAAATFAAIAVLIANSFNPMFVLALSSWLWWVLFGAGMFAAAFLVFSMCVAGRHPICSKCCRWKSIRELGVIQRDAASAKDALEAGDLASLGALSPEGDSIAVSISECPHCGREALIDVQFATETNPLVAHVTYPGAALPAFERLCKPAVPS